jgi:hypothetical protein
MAVKTHNRNGYKKGCRCDVCKTDARIGFKEQYWKNPEKARKKSRETFYRSDRSSRNRPSRQKVSALVHGTLSGYKYHMCKCFACYNALRVWSGRCALPIDTRLPENRPPKRPRKSKAKVKKIVPIKVSFPSLEERTARKLEWAGIAI